MRQIPACAAHDQRQKGKDYYCPLLKADRRGGEEEICSACGAFYRAMGESERLEKAFLFAERAHQKQMRKGSDIPYLIHLVRTWWYVQQMSDSTEEHVAALLHDVLEDTPVTEEELLVAFGETVTGLVAGESEYKREWRPAGETWEIRKRETLERLRVLSQGSEHIPAMHITLGDKLANLYSMMYEYRQVGDALWQKFNQKEKAMQGWYYGELGNLFTAFFTTGREAELVRDYQRYFKEVFGEYEISVDG